MGYDIINLLAPLSVRARRGRGRPRIRPIIPRKSAATSGAITSRSRAGRSRGKINKLFQSIVVLFSYMSNLQNNIKKIFIFWNFYPTLLLRICHKISFTFKSICLMPPVNSLRTRQEQHINKTSLICVFACIVIYTLSSVKVSNDRPRVIRPA